MKNVFFLLVVLLIYACSNKPKSDSGNKNTKKNILSPPNKIQQIVLFTILHTMAKLMIMFILVQII